MVVYTALFGDYDDLIDPKEKFEGCDFICFTDQKNLNTDIWKIRAVEDVDLPQYIMNRKYKLLPHLFLSYYDQSLYVDSNVYIKKNPLNLAKKYLDEYDIAIPRHFRNSCIYEEAEFVIGSGKAERNDVYKQILKYKNDQFPSNFGLTETNIVFRNHNAKMVIKLMNDWWRELNTYTHRDQLSLMYFVWKHNVNLKIIEENARGGKYFKIYPHKNHYENRFLGKLIRAKNIYFFNHPNSLLKKIYVTTFSNLRFKD